MTGNKDKFLDLKKQKGKVTFGYNASSNILGKGTVSLGKDKARNVLVVDKLRPSLLSDPYGYRWPPTLSNRLKTVFWQFW
jgi:hypothetical protein